MECDVHAATVYVVDAAARGVQSAIEGMHARHSQTMHSRNGPTARANAAP